MSKRVKKCFIIVGQEQSGKSFFSYQKGLEYIAHKGICLVYNDNGNPTNYSGFETVEFLKKEEHKRYFTKEDFDRINQLILFRYKNKVYHVRDFNRLFESRGVKMFRHEEEKLLFPTIHKYVGRCLFVFDDAREVFRYGVSGEIGSFISRKNHSAKGKGMDIVIQFHSFNEINRQLFGISDGIIVFDNTGGEQLKSEDEQIIKNIKEANKRIKLMPKYSKLMVGIKGDLYNKIINI